MDEYFSLNLRGWKKLACLLGAAALTAVGADEAAPFDVSRLDLAPALMKAAQPAYPLSLRRDAIEGSAVVEFVIDTHGRVIQTQVIRTNDPAFGDAAQDAIRLWVFKPGQIKGHPVNVRASQELEFNLDEAKTINMKVFRLKKDDNPPPGFDWDTPPSLPGNYANVPYPFEALRDKRAGRAVVRFVVGLDGRMQQPTIIESTAPEFGQAVVTALDNTFFTPAQKKGERRRALVEASVDFKPDGKGDVLVRTSAAAILKLLESNPAEIISLQALDAAPKLIKKVTPTFPGSLQSQTGNAVIEFFIDRGGHAQLPRVVSSSAPEFGYAAALAVGQWIFEVPKKDRKKVVARAQIPIEFNLEPPTPRKEP